MQKWNIPIDRAQRVDGIKWVVCLVIMFAPGVMVIKMSKMANIFIFSTDARTKSVTVWRKYSRASERSYLALSENAMELPWARYKPLKIQSFIIFLLTQQFFDISPLDISRTVTPKPINHTIFWKKSKRSFTCT